MEKNGLIQEKNSLGNRLNNEERVKHQTQLTLQSKELEQSNIVQNQQIILKELSDLQGEYNRVLIEYQSQETQKLDMEDRVNRLERKLLVLKENLKSSDGLLAEKEELIGILTRDFNNLKQNFLLVQQKNSNLNTQFKKNISNNSKLERSIQNEDMILKGLDRSKDLSREIEHKINSVKNYIGNNYY